MILHKLCHYPTIALCGLLLFGYCHCNIFSGLIIIYYNAILVLLYFWSMWCTQPPLHHIHITLFEVDFLRVQRGMWSWLLRRLLGMYLFGIKACICYCFGGSRSNSSECRPRTVQFGLCRVLLFTVLSCPDRSIITVGSSVPVPRVHWWSVFISHLPFGVMEFLYILLAG